MQSQRLKSVYSVKVREENSFYFSPKYFMLHCSGLEYVTKTHQSMNTQLISDRLFAFLFILNSPWHCRCVYWRVAGILFSSMVRHFWWSQKLWKLFAWKELLCVLMNRVLGPLFLFCCVSLFEMKFLKHPYLSKGFCTRKPILIRLPQSNLLQSFVCVCVLLYFILQISFDLKFLWRLNRFFCSYLSL